ncbi:uncharacterized protein (DUF2141 family) [Algoriphagus ratkowskyi]|uniref:DUF2141 domain-containing protein n=1 Tax=Algoriphagus ratkowskyi TaxID=57028 RepID=A0A2W7R3F6_9BACT|nr:DUF2141 domain-containing protein [Algoriphagus ratkowskyi]PZX52780.1 uncharacterized protein (DUF2141 family) [Algoriphagus ratkowskyi]TXD76277.1 DUF2141 domain-containing protein [Algoriphagus ratkowskyi]
MRLAILMLLFFINVSQAESNFGTIELVISEASSDDGVIQILIFDQDKGWPESIESSWKILTLPVENGIAKKMITSVPAGNYAITVFHDHDEDGKIRKNKVGYPLDGFGLSNNPSLLFGEPSFSKCSKKVISGKSTRFDIELR